MVGSRRTRQAWSTAALAAWSVTPRRGAVMTLLLRVRVAGPAGLPRGFGAGRSGPLTAGARGRLAPPPAAPPARSTRPAPPRPAGRTAASPPPRRAPALPPRRAG